MITVLFAPSRVAAYRLNVAAGMGNYPNGGPSRRNYQGPDMLERLLVTNCLPIGADVCETLPRALPNNAWTGFGYVAQSGHSRGFYGIDGFGSGDLEQP